MFATDAYYYTATRTVMRRSQIKFLKQFDKDRRGKE